GQYGNTIVGAYLLVAGTELLYSDFSVDSSIVENDSLFAGDYFASAVGMVNTATGEIEGVAVQFRLLAGTLWDSDALPSAFDLSDFDPFDPAATNNLGTGILLPASLVDGPVGFAPLTSASLYAVPAPASVVLMISSLMTLAASRKRADR
ncbi:MAG: hypothetical protein AB8G18_15750, partial [Gammaproteobacteria bacterium]